MARCIWCGKESRIISRVLGVCLGCIRAHYIDLQTHLMSVHARVRRQFNLPRTPWRERDGLKCNICVNQCVVPLEGVGYCGVRKNIGGRFLGSTADVGDLLWYHDPLPTNCVADWVCPGGTGEGYPRFSHTEGPEYGYKNLAVFYNGCTFNCLFCQNWHHKGVTQRAKWTRVEELVDAIDEKTSCICYFGGDPSAQLPHAIATSHYAIKRSKGAILRICWETNGSMSRAYLEEMLSISIQTGGCIKFDLKAYDERLNIALCGISNKRTLDNFAFLAGFSAQRPRPPLVIASTLLIPGYVDEDEVSKIAGFIASLSKDIPYSLLAYHPQFCMTDLPTTSRSHALGCLQVAKEQGLTKVKLGNVHLLREVDYPSPMT